MQKIINYLKKEIVLTVALVLAIGSMFLVPPDAQYVSYIDFHTLGLLGSLMIVMEGLRRMGVFSQLAKSILRRCGDMRKMVLLLVLLCFFSSMLITNDVALITFVPLTIVMLELVGREQKEKWLVFVVVMQTIAANLGSMLTPIGNPQNLYLYNLSGMALPEFIGMMLPYTLVSLIGLGVCILFVTRGATGTVAMTAEDKQEYICKRKLLAYGILFALCLLVVAGMADYRAVVAIVVLAVLGFDRKTLFAVDYSLLLTFSALFVFIGNMGRIDMFRTMLESVVAGREILTAVVASQVISNVPAALLLSGFSDHFRELVVGVNIGGLGTLIASMASLISFKYIAAESSEKRMPYLLQFTGYNLGFLGLLLPFAMI